METEKRESGISVVGKIPWGTHFCFFYETEQDLLDTLVPYFKAGLENNEFCMWIVSPPFTQQGIAAALRQAIPELDRHLAQRNIEILFYHEWYLYDGAFEPSRVIEKWKNKVAEALARGYAGLRGIGNEDWLTEEYWKDFAQFEKELDRWIANQRMLVACPYSLALRGVQVFDVAKTHEYAIAKRQGIWQVLETPELVQTKAEIKRLNEELEERVTQRTRELTATNRELQRTEAAEREQRTRLQTLSNQLLVAQEQERRAIARELHDEIGQVLNAVSANLRALELLPNPTTREERMNESLTLVDEALAQIRDLSLELRPSMLDDFGLISALEWYAKRQAQRAGFSIEFAIELRDARLPPNLEITVFRVVQIALTNVARHAQAKQVRVALLQRDSTLELVIQDDGVGFDVDLALQRASHGATLGLLSMQERVRLARGDIEILSSFRAGTLIRARFPIE